MNTYYIRFSAKQIIYVSNINFNKELDYKTEFDGNLHDCYEICEVDTVNETEKTCTLIYKPLIIEEDGE